MFVTVFFTMLSMNVIFRISTSNNAMRLYPWPPALRFRKTVFPLFT